ncbi:thermonuclease family protein [Proteobacteria bacterium 005FR1]|nr:thermonuclease family protein [Proteobacteria bacterium 005FR1]
MLFSRILATGIILSLVPVLAWGQQCPEPTVHERVRLSAVHDGDTLRLTDGRRVRLLAINAPELATDGKAEQPLARASREAAEAFFADTELVHLSFESRRTDRYGRILAHVTHPSGRNLESYLVRQGLALPLAVPPDMAYARCLQELAEEARRERRGLWRTDYWQPLPATRLEGVQAQFRVLCGEISKVDLQKDVWLELEGDLVIRIDRDDLPHFRGSRFDPGRAETWPGRGIRVSGWLQDRSGDKQLMAQGFKPFVVQARTPYALDWLEDSQSCR